MQEQRHRTGILHDNLVGLEALADTVGSPDDLPALPVLALP